MSKRNRDKRIRHALVKSAPPSPAKRGRWSTWHYAAGVAAVAVLAGSFVVPDLVGRKAAPVHAQAGVVMGPTGTGLEPGSRVPSFSATDVLSGEPITSRTLYPRRTLLFFSEGVMCQSCFEQIRGLEQMGDSLRARGIQLVSITPDPPGALEQAIGQYGITTPMISDESRMLSREFNTLGLGMHADTPGHAFALIDRGKVVWYRDYWLAPYRTMYVPPADVLAALPGA